jgi:hypothetical protein
VNVLRDISPFAKLIAMQTASTAPRLPDNLFDAWVDSVSTVELNTLPVRWTERPRPATAESRRPAIGGDF